MIKDWKIAVLISESSWFMQYAISLINKIDSCHEPKIFNNHKNIDSSYDIVFILSYFKIIEEEFLDKHKHNLVVHESDLPKGKGWSPLFWQILEGKNNIPIVLFEADSKVDSGKIYLKDNIIFDGNELNAEIREKQAEKTIELCIKFIDNYENITPSPQIGDESFYPKRSPKDSEININETIRKQFNLLRIVNNEKYPAFFFYENNKYILKIFKEQRKKNE